MAKRPAGNRHQMIHCDICGEDYAATYKRCPFCNGRPPEEQESGRRGRREMTNTRGGGYTTRATPLRIAMTVVSLALIVAAVCIVVSIVKPLVDKGDPSSIPSSDPTSAPTTAVTPTPEVSTAPTIPPDQTATGLTLDQSDFTLSSAGEKVTIHATFSPANSVGYVTWSSSNPEVVSVDETGTVTGIGRTNGVSSATITATLTGTSISQSCTVRCSFDAPAGGVDAVVSPSPAGGTGTSSGTLSLNREDFTMSATYPTFQMEVSGTTSTPAWSIADTSVATVSSTGLVTRVGRGSTTLTCTVDGQTLTCIVRCN